ncbi:unnamed protein product [Rotaria sp. Silwood2]|nr:unnamed protein product [Rotaria sp. Silwood2]CAF3173356.1 unnamed protein product [Rotaria sp. Silwood2]CAF4062991.1 unnamed protein product [Rotaria sp. Silwood2]CAF4440795.1 unnamed protein product [Rotaria sp. Silwood2]
MNRFLLSIKYPHTIKQHPADIESTGKWKATQLRVFLLCIALPFAVHYYIPQPHRRQPPAQTFTQPSTPTPEAVLKIEEDVSTDIDIRGAIDKINLRLESLENNVKEFRAQQNSMMRFYHGINLLDSEPPIEPTVLLCSSIRKLYTNEEIKNGIVFNDRMEKIKELIKETYFKEHLIEFEVF